MARLLISAGWRNNQPILKYYNLDTEKIEVVTDTYYENHWLSDEPNESPVYLTNALTNKRVTLYDHKGLFPNKEAKNYEHKLRKHHNYLLSELYITGAIYEKKKQLSQVELNSDQITALEKTTKNAPNSAYTKYLKDYTNILSQPIPDIKRLAVDIEVHAKEGVFPSVKTPKYPVTCIGLAGSDGRRTILTLNDETLHKQDKKGDHTHISYFPNEKMLLEVFFNFLQDYPIIVTFNGDDFDFAYLFVRARELGITNIPMEVNEEDFNKPLDQRDAVTLPNGIHLDLYRIFKNRSLHNYAFNARYKQFGLDPISMAILGEGKIHHNVPLNQLTQEQLSQYCLNDAELTLKLTTYSNNLLMKLLFLISRITKTSIEDIGRFGISNWIKQMLYHEHRKQKILIPNREDLAASKGTTASTRAIIKDKKYKGAFVMEPVKGAHFNVDVVDFGCFDTETEILTKRGWQTIDTIQEGEECLSVNLKTGDVENDTIQKVFKYDYDGDLVNIKTPHKLDFLFTDTHRIVYNRKKGGNISGFRKELIVQPFKDITYYHYALPCFGTWKGNERQEYIKIGDYTFETNYFFEFLGRFLGNGNLHKSGISITDNLKYKDRHESIKHIFEKMGFSPKVCIEPLKNSHRTSIFNVKFMKTFKELLQNKIYSKERTIPDEFLEYNIEHLHYLFKGLMELDGSTSKSGEKTFSSCNKKLAEQFQLLALKCGYNCSFKPSKTIGFNGPIDYYACTLSGFRQKKASFVISKQQSHIHKVQYKGKIWCAATQNTTLIIRRKGRVIVTGNSLYPSIIKSNNISYETINCGHSECKDNIIPETPHYTCTKTMGMFPLLIGVFRDLRLAYFKKLSKNKQLSKEERELYDAIAQAIKVILNGTYGVLGAEAFQLYCLPVAESVTAQGRHIITKTKEFTESLGLQVIYGDTDSLFIVNANESQLQQIMKFSQDKYNIDLEVDKHYRYIMFSALKKNYLGIKDDGKIDIKGLIGKKSNIPKFIRNCFNEVCAQLQKVNTPQELEDAKSIISDIIKKCYIKLENLDYPIEEFVYNHMIQKSLDKYGYKKITDTRNTMLDDPYNTVINTRELHVPPHVKVAKEMKRNGIKIEDKMFIPFVKTRGGNSTWIKMTKKEDIDIGKYKETLAKVFEPLMDVLQIDYKEIIKTKVLTLDDIFNQNV
ncbi:MAG: DNA polymerase domain-containing protein [Candidatus Nitrosocosmicus sp.]|nr:hypothetical protein [Candidatus Nitrosocosmicus sp.]